MTRSRQNRARGRESRWFNPFEFALALRRSPHRVLIGTWILFVAMYWLQPIQYLEPARWFAWLFLGGCCLAFVVGSLVQPLFGMRVPRVGGRERQVLPLQGMVEGRFINRLVIALGVIGTFGTMALLIERLRVTGLDYAAGLTAVRMQRANDYIQGIDVARSPLLYLAHATNSYGVVSLLLMAFYHERLRTSARLVGFCGILAPVVWSAIHGGRWPMFMAFILLAGCGLVRWSWGLRFFPRDRWMLGAFWGLIVVTFIYSAFIFVERREQFGTSGEDEELHMLERGVILKPVVKDIVEVVPELKGAATTAFGFFWYATLSVPAVDVVLENRRDISRYYGLYQVTIVERLISLLAMQQQEYAVERQLYYELYRFGVYGVYYGLWGSMLLDFGLNGALLAAFLLGFVSRSICARAMATGHPTLILLEVFVFATIVTSPTISFISIANGVFIFAAIVSTVLIFGRGRRVRAITWRQQPAAFSGQPACRAQAQPSG